MKQLMELFISFAKVGVMTFGGGYAMLPMLQKEIVENKKWISEEELIDYYGIGQCTPGVIAVNTATFVGYKQAGVLGGIVSTLGVVFPSLIIIIAIASVLDFFSTNKYVQSAFAGIRICVVALVFNAVIKLFKKSVKDGFQMALFLVILVVLLLFNVSPVIIVLISAILGIGVKVVFNR